MSAPTLVVMAAGIGSRYGGLKQVDPIGPSGEIILDYSIYDSIRAGFGKIVFVIRKDIEEVFREKIGGAVESKIDVDYVFQDINDLPDGFSVPDGRAKPWGTGHAVLAARKSVSTPFAVINADDFYGSSAFAAIGEYLKSAHDRDGVYDFSMVGYALENTLSENGTVARGVCELTADGNLMDIFERTSIQRFDGGIKYTENGIDWINLAPDTIVSLNTWGFTLSMFSELEARFPAFLRSMSNPLKGEYFLPTVVGDLVKEGRATVKVLPTNEKWFGVTYQEDRPTVQNAIRDLIANGVYPQNLWGKK